MSVPENPKQTKNPITLKIKFKSSSLEQFIERYSVDVSKSGIFIRTKEPLAVGTQLRFEFQLQDGNALLSGEGTVVWNRAFDPARSSVAPGMGVRFDKLSGDSQKVLERILTEKARRPDSNLESRFDAGVRALREGAAAEANVTSQSQATPKGDNSSFGDEPTRAMPADQVTKLAAAAMQEEDMPTKHAPPDLTDEVRRAVGAAAESVKQMTPLTPMTAPPQQQAGPAPGLGRTLLGQGFMMAPRTGNRDAPSAPGGSSRDAPSVEMTRQESSQPLSVPGRSEGVADSAKTPTASVEEQRARIADSNRTPSGPSKSGAEEPAVTPPPVVKPPEPMAKPPEPMAKPPEPMLRPSEPISRPPEPMAKPPEPMAFPPPAEVAPVTPLPTLSPAPQSSKPSGPPVGLIIGIVVLIAILGALAYVFVTGGTRGSKPTPTSGSTESGAGSANGPGSATDPSGGPGTAKPGTTEPPKAPEPSNVPVKPAESTEGIEVTTEPSGVRVDFAGKQYGPTPTRVPGLTVGSQVKLSLRGYQEAMIRLHNQPEEGKPLFFKLTAIERVVEINSTPKGADVLLDGKKVGKTPFVLKKLDTAKVHQIEVRRAGFTPWTHNVSDTESFVVKNRKEVLTLNAALTPSDEGGKKGAHPAKHDGASAPTPTPGSAPAAAPSEAPKPAEAAPTPTPTPTPPPAEPAKEPANGQ